MAEKETKEGNEKWRYQHPGSHPDNKPPLTIVAKPSEEALKHEEELMNRSLEKDHLPPPEEAVADKEKEDEDLESKTVPELREIAGDKGIHVPSDANKSDIIKAIKKG